MGIPISSLPVASDLTGDEVFPIVQSGSTKQTTLSDIPYTPAGTDAVTTTVQSKLRETVSVKDFGAVGDGDADDTAAIKAAIATGKSVFFPEPAVYYNITDEIGPKFPGQILYTDCRVRGMIRNTTNANALAYFGNPANANGATPQAGIRGLTFQGNALTTRGIVLSTVNENGSTWTDASKDCLLEDVAVDGVGAGWALECYSWCNEIRNFTAYEGNKKGAIFAVDANQNNVNGIYITGCTEQSLQVGGHATSTRTNRGNTFHGVVCQQSGGAEGVVVIADADNTVISGLYSESNNSKGAPRAIFVKSTARGTVINGVSHLSGGSVVYRNEGYGSIINGVVSSNVTGAIVTNAGTGTLVAIGIDWMDGVTPSGAKFSDLSTSKTGFYIDGNGLVDTTISSFAPILRFVDQSAGVKKSRLRYDQDIMRLEYDSLDDGTYAQLMWAFNPTVPEFIADGAVRPNTDNARNLGSATRRWATVYAGTGTINTSDGREKQDIEELDAAERRVAASIKGLVKKFRFRDAVQAKGESARIHVGVIAQEVIAAFQAEGLDPMRYGIVCYDEWEAEEERPAGNRFGVRYEELLAFTIAAL